MVVVGRWAVSYERGTPVEFGSTLLRTRSVPRRARIYGSEASVSLSSRRKGLLGSVWGATQKKKMSQESDLGLDPLCIRNIISS